jgi:hypothetical protein
LANIRQAVQSVDPEQPVDDVSSMEEIVHDALKPWRFALSLLGGLAGLAIVLTGVSLFAVVSYLTCAAIRRLSRRPDYPSSSSSSPASSCGCSKSVSWLKAKVSNPYGWKRTAMPPFPFGRLETSTT